MCTINRLINRLITAIGSVDKWQYYIKKLPLDCCYLLLAICYMLYEALFLKLTITCKKLFHFARWCMSRNFYFMNTSLAALGSLAHRLQCCTACKIQNIR